MLTNIKGIVFIIVVIASVAAASVFFKLAKTEEANRVSAEEALAKEKVLKGKAEKNLSLAKEDRDYLQQRLADIRQEAQALETEVIGYKREAESKRQRIADLTNTSDFLKENINQISSNISEIRTRIANVIKESLQVKEEMVLAEKTRDALREKLNQYKRATPAAKTEESSFSENIPEQASDSPYTVSKIPGLSGEILTVNREFDFIVLNLGKNDGIEEGMVLDISRDGKVTGEAKVETVRENISAAAVVNKESIAGVRAGDKISSPSGKG